MAQQDACTLLDQDHKEAEQMFQSYRSERDDSRKLALTERLCNALRVHIQIENEIFYPAFQQATRDNKLVDESRHEHDEALSMIDTLERAGRPDDATMQKLEAAIKDHVEDERTKMFPEARASQSMDLVGLAQQLQARKSELMAGHPA
ncbi:MULTISPECIES: hemerythrin domain-containing protein [Ramlibacter]|uniref:Hemerythrin domain-containing protein n=1 Tax=Ramlibacter aquaticus TaxID=2780094 RepID=A0ABR9SGZ8_9BURK|nr:MULTISPECIES: hemerythrin domain-containing protein [Ramlibacter]MBE7941637.1 hemerythrin domain-containing protein [Ramlibacter aquaticus]